MNWKVVDWNIKQFWNCQVLKLLKISKYHNHIFKSETFWKSCFHQNFRYLNIRLSPSARVSTFSTPLNTRFKRTKETIKLKFSIMKNSARMCSIDGKSELFHIYDFSESVANICVLDISFSFHLGLLPRERTKSMVKIDFFSLHHTHIPRALKAS